MLDFLEAIANSSRQQVAAKLWRLAPIKPSPFAAKLIEARAVRGGRQRWLRTLRSAFRL